jgi:predicted polyphosphate/ATP-dependent NAD kinase
MPSSGEEAAVASIAHDLVSKMIDGCLYILGPGTTTRAIADELGVPKTLIGVDVVLDGRVIATDANEAQLLDLLDEYSDCAAKIVVTPIGGQGYLFGRGNQQISYRIVQRIGRDNLIVVSTPDKLHSLGTRPLLVDTGDRVVDEGLAGYLEVVTGFNQRAVRKVAS